MTDRTLHVVARLLLRVCSPDRACKLLGRVGTCFPALHGREEILRARDRIRDRGTCLTRSLAVAARAPAVEVVIGVMPPGQQPLRAHAWLELFGEPLDPRDIVGHEIARIRPARRDPTRKAQVGSGY